MNKGIFVGRIIITAIISIFLFFIIINSKSIISKIICIPFLLCGIFTIVKNVFLLKENKRYVNIFDKLFILSFLMFWFFILIYSSYLFIKNNNYFSILFTIPFWITGIYFVCKFLFNIKFKINSTFNFKIVISCFLILCTLIIGPTFLYIGIRNTYKLNKLTKNYILTNGYFKDYEVYNTSKKSNTTYKLIYTYEVSGKKYSISTDYGVGSIPEKNSIRKVKYNSQNPNKAILLGTNHSNFLIYFGAFFTLVGTTFVLSALHIKGFFDKIKIDILGIYFGVVFLIIGIGIVLFQMGTTSSFIGTIKSFEFWILIPILFIIVGVFQIIKCILGSKKDNL